MGRASLTQEISFKVKISLHLPAAAAAVAAVGHTASGGGSQRVYT